MNNTSKNPAKIWLNFKKLLLLILVFLSLVGLVWSFLAILALLIAPIYFPDRVNEEYVKTLAYYGLLLLSLYFTITGAARIYRELEEEN